MSIEKYFSFNFEEEKKEMTNEPRDNIADETHESTNEDVVPH